MNTKLHAALVLLGWIPTVLVGPPLSIALFLLWWVGVLAFPVRATAPEPKEEP